MGLQTKTLNGNGDKVLVVDVLATDEVAVHTLMFKNNTKLTTTVEIFFNDEVVYNFDIDTKSEYAIKKTINVPQETSMYIKAPAGVKCIASFYKSALDSATALTEIQQAVIEAKNAVPKGTINDSVVTTTDTFSSKKISKFSISLEWDTTDFYVTKPKVAKINNYDNLTIYECSCSRGTVYIEDDTLYYTPPLTAGDATLIVNDKTYTLNILGDSVVRPTIISPINKSTNINKNFTVYTSAFEVASQGSDTHASTSWYVATSPLFEVKNIVYKSINNTTKLTSIDLVDMPIGTDLYIKAIHNGTNLGASLEAETITVKTSDFTPSLVSYNIPSLPPYTKKITKDGKKMYGANGHQLWLLDMETNQHKSITSQGGIYAYQRNNTYEILELYNGNFLACSSIFQNPNSTMHMILLDNNLKPIRQWLNLSYINGTVYMLEGEEEGYVYLAYVAGTSNSYVEVAKFNYNTGKIQKLKLNTEPYSNDSIQGYKFVYIKEIKQLILSVYLRSSSASFQGFYFIDTNLNIKNRLNYTNLSSWSEPMIQDNGTLVMFGTHSNNLTGLIYDPITNTSYGKSWIPSSGISNINVNTITAKQDSSGFFHVVFSAYNVYVKNTPVLAKFTNNLEYVNGTCSYINQNVYDMPTAMDFLDVDENGNPIVTLSLSATVTGYLKHDYTERASPFVNHSGYSLAKTELIENNVYPPSLFLAQSELMTSTLLDIQQIDTATLNYTYVNWSVGATTTTVTKTESEY